MFSRSSLVAISKLQVALVLSSTRKVCVLTHIYLSLYMYRTLIVLLSSLSPAPPLTLENVLEAVKNVQSWRTLGVRIYSPLSSKLDAIHHQHVSDEACLKAVIEGFLSGKGRYKPSWRRVIWSLYRVNEIQLAEHIRSFAEPVKGK